MKIYGFLVLLMVSFTACTTSSNSIKKETILQTKEHNKTVIIDLDEELSIGDSVNDLRDEKSMVLDRPIYIGDNDEVSFKGDVIAKKSPLTIHYGQHEIINFNGKTFTIKTSALNSEDTIKVKDKEGNVFIDMKIIKEEVH